MKIRKDLMQVGIGTRELLQTNGEHVTIYTVSLAFPDTGISGILAECDNADNAFQHAIGRSMLMTQHLERLRDEYKEGKTYVNPT